MGLTLSRIAMANVAWCATDGNRYPPGMLRRCFSRHTAELLQALRPDVMGADREALALEEVRHVLDTWRPKSR